MSLFGMSKKGSTNVITEGVIGVVLGLFLFSILITIVTSSAWYTSNVANTSLETLLLITFPTLIIVAGVFYVINNMKTKSGRR